MKKPEIILLIDDDVDDQLYFREAIEEIKPACVCKIANNGLEGLQQIAASPLPDIVFLDLNMPIMNGYEFLENIKKNKQYHHIPVIIFTTSKNSADIERCRLFGASLYLTKPVDFATLCTKLNSVFELNFDSTAFMI
ncbi:MAG TPA: response regulator [Ferruginibacter sp.]|nr:response regulator [Ferruginibacter sp.]